MVDGPPTRPGHALCQGFSFAWPMTAERVEDLRTVPV
jgi:hypothetical protein